VLFTFAFQEVFVFSFLSFWEVHQLSCTAPPTFRPLARFAAGQHHQRIWSPSHSFAPSTSFFFPIFNRPFLPCSHCPSGFSPQIPASSLFFPPESSKSFPPKPRFRTVCVPMLFCTIVSIPGCVSFGVRFSVFLSKTPSCLPCLCPMVARLHVHLGPRFRPTRLQILD